MSRYVDEIQLSTIKATTFKASFDAFRPLGSFVKSDDKLMFYFEDVELEVQVPKMDVEVVAIRTMKSIPDKFSYISTVEFQNHVYHIYIRTYRK